MENILIQLRKTIRQLFKSGNASPPTLKSMLSAIQHMPWQKLDRIYASSQQKLRESPRWRTGPTRIHETTSALIERFQQHTSISGKSYLDLGCGAFHPYGISTAMIVNGVRKAHAIDIQDGDHRRWATALFELLSNMLCFPEKWCLSEIDTTNLMRNVRRFNLEALQTGNLEPGVADIPIHHHINDIKEVAIDTGSIDLFGSRAVLEHFLDLPTAIAQLHNFCCKGAIGVHHIDMRDHRAYQSQGFHHWSFLTKSKGPTQGLPHDESYPREGDTLCNRLRWHEVRRIIENGGFEFLSEDLVREEIPAGLRDDLLPEYRKMNDEDLSITAATFVIRK